MRQPASCEPRAAHDRGADVVRSLVQVSQAWLQKDWLGDHFSSQGAALTGHHDMSPLEKWRLQCS